MKTSPFTNDALPHNIGLVQSIGLAGQEPASTGLVN